MGNNVFLSASELSCNVWLDMNNNIITNLPSPVNPGDGVNKTYVDNSISSHLTAPFIKITPIPGLTATNTQDALSELTKEIAKCLPLSGGKMAGTINMNNNSITNLATPTQDQETYAANVQYVNTYVQNNLTSVVQPAINNIKQELQTNTNSITNLTNSLKEYLPLLGGNMTGNLQMNNHTVTGLTTPNDTETTNAANVQYVNDYINSKTANLLPLINKNTEDIENCNKQVSSLEGSLSGYLQLSGGTMTGNLQMNNHAITGLTTPNDTETTNAANVQYVNNYIDSELQNLDLAPSPFYVAKQTNPHSLTTTDCVWVNTTASMNFIYQSEHSDSYFSFNADYTNLYLLSKGIYMFNFMFYPFSQNTLVKGTATITINLHDGNTSKFYGNLYLDALTGGGNISTIIPIINAPSSNTQYYLTYSSSEAIDFPEQTMYTFLQIVWLPIN